MNRQTGTLGLAFLIWVFSPALALGYESRLYRDPELDIAALARSGEIVAKVTRVNGGFDSDASAVLKVDFERLAALSIDYDRYAEMGMPNLRASRVVERGPGDYLYTWSWMSLSGQTSKHFLEVRLKPAMAAAGARGAEWEFVRRHAGWTQEDEPAFRRMEGSWYMEPLADGTVYVRYFLSAEIDTGVPAFIVNLVARGAFRDGVRDVIRVLAREAARN